MRRLVAAFAAALALMAALLPAAAFAAAPAGATPQATPVAMLAGSAGAALFAAPGPASKMADITSAAGMAECERTLTHLAAPAADPICAAPGAPADTPADIPADITDLSDSSALLDDRGAAAGPRAAPHPPAAAGGRGRASVHLAGLLRPPCPACQA